MKGLKHRSRTAESSVKQLEKVSKETQNSYEALRVELQEARTQLAARTRLLEDVQGERDRLAAEVEETRKLVEANEKVIEWLHQQINEDSINRILGSNVGNTGPFKFSSAPIPPLPSPPAPEEWIAKGKERMPVPVPIPASISIPMPRSIPQPASSSTASPPDRF